MYNDIDNILQSINEITTTANISYLPSGFTTIKPMLQTLAKKKREWNIQVLENGEDYDLAIEDQINIKIPKKYLYKFKEDSGFDVLATKSLNFDKYLGEAVEDEIKSKVEQVRGALYELLISVPISTADQSLEYFINIFNGQVTSSISDKSSILNYATLEDDIDALVNKIVSKYKNDVANLDMLYTALKSKSPLNAFEVFNKYDNLFSGVVVAKYKNTQLVYMISVNTQFQTTSMIQIDNEIAIDRLDDEQDFKTDNIKKVFSRNREVIFNTRQINTIKTTLDEVV